MIISVIVNAIESYSHDTRPYFYRYQFNTSFRSGYFVRCACYNVRKRPRSVKLLGVELAMHRRVGLLRYKWQCTC